MKCSPAFQRQESNISFSIKTDTGLKAIMTTLITKAVITINKNYNCQEDANEYEQGIKMPGRTVTGESQHP